MNCADQLALLRDFIDEATASHWSDLNLLRRLNMAQRKIAVAVAQTPGDWLVKSTAVTPSDSVITLPSDCSKPIYLEETSSGKPLRWLESVTHRRVSRSIGTSLDYAGSREAYPLLNTIEVNQDSFSTQCTLWYQIRVPNLHTGTVVSPGANAFTMAADRERVYLADYYNSAYVEIIDNSSDVVDIRSEITDYTAAGVCTITGTPGASDKYGTISRLPEETHMLIVLEATILAMMKPSANLDMTVYRHYRDELRETRKEVYGWLESRILGPMGTVIGDPI